MSLYVQVHTLTIKKKISAGEVGRICRTFSIPEVYDSENQLYISPTGCRGIKHICIEKQKKWRKGQVIGFQYAVELEINAVKLLNRAEVSMVELSPANAKEMYDKVEDYFVRVLQLDVRNCKARKWLLIDFHCGLDVRIPDADINKIPFIIRAMNRSLNFDNRNYCWFTSNPAHLSGQEQYESLRFQNTLYIYNIYYKYQEIVNKGIQVSAQGLQEALNTIRIEMQMNSQGVSKKVGSPQEFGLLESIAVSNRLLQMVCRDMKTFFGTGTYVAYEEAMELIDASTFTQEEKQYIKLIYTGAYKFNLYPFVNQVWIAATKEGIPALPVQAHIRESIKKIESLGIALGGLSQDELLKCGVKQVENINIYIDKMLVPVTKANGKGEFSKIALLKDGTRWKCQPVLRDYKGEGKRYQKTGITPAVVERKILKLIYGVMKENLAMVTTPEEQNRILLQTKDETERYITVIHTKEGRAAACEFLDLVTKMST